MKLLVIFMVFVAFCTAEASIWDWVWGKSDESHSPPKIEQLTLKKIPFEVKTEDEKFLEEARKYTDLKLSELDECQHKIILKIQASCMDMTEDQLAKLSVNLLNCQSAIEGRQQFPCSDDMTLRQCTSAMDSDMWNTYHLMNNRARAVCYHTRQQQFRIISQMTVNKLLTSAQDQIRSMDSLKEAQEKLGTMTVGAMDSVAAGQEALLTQQERMKVSQQNLHSFVSLNVHQLKQEKALIAAGHQLLAKLTEDISSKIDSASSLLAHQSSEQQQNHQEILNDLKIIQKQAHTIWSEIEHSTMEILAQHQSAAAQYEDTLQKLTKINDTVTFLLELMESTKHELDERLGWLSSIVEAAGLYLVGLHVLYLLVGMITTAFFQAPTVTKLVLVSLVILNLCVICHAGKEHSLGFIPITFLILVSAAVHGLVGFLWTLITAYRQSRLQPQTQVVANGFTPRTLLVPPQTPSPPASPELLSRRSPMNILWISVRQTWNACTSWFKLWLFTNPFALKEGKSPAKHVLEDDSSDTDDDYYKSKSPTPSRTNDVSSSLKEHRDVSPSLRQRHNVSPSLRQPLYRVFPTPSRTPSRSSSPMSSSSGSRPLCHATTRQGILCRNVATPGSDTCRIHSLNSSYH